MPGKCHTYVYVCHENIFLVSEERKHQVLYVLTIIYTTENWNLRKYLRAKIRLEDKGGE